MQTQLVEVTQSFDSKWDAIGFMMTLKADKILFIETATDYKIVYAAERSIVDGEVVNKGEEQQIITS